MSDGTETDGASTVHPPIVQPVKAKFSAGMLAAVAVVAIVLGFAGGVVSHAVFPASQGKMGVSGKQGPVGETGSQGPPGSAATVSTSNLGVCWNTTYGSDGLGNDFVQSISMESPSLVSGTQSCPSGSFVGVTAQAPSNG
jgi:hypothetical protein